MQALSLRLAAIVDALPLRPGLRVIEIGCGPGAAARAVADRVGPSGHVLAVDRSAKAIAQLTEASADLIAARRLTPRHVAAETLELEPGEARYDIAFAVRVGAFDGRHPEAGAQALERLGRALVTGGRLFIDGGDPLREVPVPAEREPGREGGPPRFSGEPASKSALARDDSAS
jgi:ubiquinone/menaquinone biosynthesis C-methylase UbiE